MLEKLLQKNHLIISTILAKKIIFHIHIFTLSFIVVVYVQKRDQDLLLKNISIPSGEPQKSGK